MKHAPPTDKATSHTGWGTTMPPGRIEALEHPLPSVHDQDEVDHLIHSTFNHWGPMSIKVDPAVKRMIQIRRPARRERPHLSACALLAASLACGYAFGLALVELSHAGW